MMMIMMIIISILNYTVIVECVAGEQIPVKNYSKK